MEKVNVEQECNNKRPIIISMINMKGGVGKTTTTIGLAEALANEYGKKVLVIDLDPQTNATSVLIPDTTWEQLNDNGQTIYHIFKEATDKNYTKIFDLKKAIQKNVGNLVNVENVDLLCSSVDMIYNQDDIIHSNPVNRRASNIDYLKNAISSIINNYHYILIDCPPSLNLITQNGLAISDAYIIPTIPDALSTHGIPSLVRKIKEFSDDINKPIRPLGIVRTKVRTVKNSLTQQIQEILKQPNSSLRAIQYPDSNNHKEVIKIHLFKQQFEELKGIAEAAQYHPTKRSYESKWGKNTGTDENICYKFNKFASEVLEETKKIKI